MHSAFYLCLSIVLSKLCSVIRYKVLEKATPLVALATEDCPAIAMYFWKTPYVVNRLYGEKVTKKWSKTREKVYCEGRSASHILFT